MKESIIYNSNEPNKEILKKIYLETLQVRGEQINSRFADKYVREKNCKLNIKEHKIKIRNKEKYLVIPAGTVSL